jgi:predicted AAA+ superfamily ATPase
MEKTADNEKKIKKLPGNRQSFREIISENRFYVDKTPYVYQMVVESDYNYLFLSRPRRFGKTILLDTLNEFF